MNSNQQTEHLFDLVQRMCDEPFFRETVWEHCPFVDELTAADKFDLSIHPNDQMLWHSLRHHQDANASFSQYYSVGLQQFFAMQQIQRAIHSAQSQHLRVLDFACGYGRLLRFLVHRLPVDNITASEIQADALDFVRDHFGVRGIPSFYDPLAFKPGTDFDLIWVASLFSHLPDQTFGPWLEQLTKCLTPTGILCFSVHDVSQLPSTTTMPKEGIHYLPSSENADLNGDSYGTTFVTEDYVRGKIAALCGSDRRVFRIPRGLANQQDIYIVGGTANPDLDALRGFRYGPWGWVDEREMRASGELYLRGWAASLDDGPIEHVRVTVDDQTFECPTGMPRPDVAQVLNDPRLSHCGWEFSIGPEIGNRSSFRIKVSAETSSGERALLLTGEYARRGGFS